MIIKNALIYTPRHTFEEGSLTIREGRIVPLSLIHISEPTRP